MDKKIIKKLLLKEDPLILEIGANDGSDTQEFLNIFKNVKICCFEPDPRAINKFKESINDPRCELFEIAISDQDGEMDLHLSEKVGEGPGGYKSSSIKEPKKHLEKWPHIEFNKKVIVPIKKLDSWTQEKNIREIDFLWVDVQGAEKEFINGALETLDNTKYLFTEFYNEEMYEGQLNLDEICRMLPNFNKIGIFGDNVLLRNNNIEYIEGEKLQMNLLILERRIKNIIKKII